MKIAYICADPGIPLGGGKGASVHLRSLAAAMARRGHQLLLLCAKTDGSNPPPANVRVVRLPAEGPPSWLVGQLAAAGTEAILERYSLPSGAALQAARTLGLSFTLEVNAPLVEEAARFRGLQNIDRWLEREQHLLLRSDRVIVVSTALQEHALAAGARPGAVTVIPNGVELGLFRRGGRDAIRDQLGIEGGIVIGFAGSLKPWHGVVHLVDALAKLPGTHRLVIVGDGPERDALEERASDLRVRERVTFAGPVAHAQVPAYLDSMDIGAAPFEPLPNFYFSPLKVAEYLAAGLPVVASRQGDVPLLVGDAGILYEPGDQAALTESLRRLGEDGSLRERLARNAIARAEALDWDRVAARVEDVLVAARRQETRA